MSGLLRHQEWKNQDGYRRDISRSTENLRYLIQEISKKLAIYDKKSHETVVFPSDNFSFDATKVSQPLPKNKINDGYDFSKKLRRGEEEDNTFIADNSEILELTELALKLLNFADVHDEIGVENAKLT